MTALPDDGTVVVEGVVMDLDYRRMTVEEYLSGDETNRPQELAYGVLREPPAPSYLHQTVVGFLFEPLSRHVRRHGLGVVILSPMDVILDRERALVVQPDLMFVSQQRMEICADRLWGAPDLVIEVLSSSTRRHDSETKIAWYRNYGVRECWLADPVSAAMTVVDLAAGTDRTFEGTQLIRSIVLPRLRLRTRDAFFR